MITPLSIALSLYNEKELSGATHNPKILEMFSKINNQWVKDDETAWCASFVGYCLETAGFTSTKKLNARSYLEYGIPTTKPEVGDIVVFWRGSKTSWQGHVAFFIRQEGDNVSVLGGNQSNMVNISHYPKSQLLGYRKLPKTEMQGILYLAEGLKILNELK